jgi:pSer/pThr/pTyr-binding forkhead associated (FHA) protein
MRVLLQSVDCREAPPEIVLERFPFVVGRRSHCDAALPLIVISRHHCRFTLKNNEVFVQDLGSHNGTRVNGRPAHEPLVLHDGDELALGPICFRVVLPELLSNSAHGGDICYRDPDRRCFES